MSLSEHMRQVEHIRKCVDAYVAACTDEDGRQSSVALADQELGEALSVILAALVAGDNALSWFDFIEDVQAHGPDDDPLTINVTRTNAGWRQARAHYRSALGQVISCPNAPDEYGNWPCDPAPLTNVCTVCGWTPLAPPPEARS